MQDPWCSKTVAKNGNPVSGGAARQVRIAALGGMDNIIKTVAQSTLESADLVVKEQQKPRLRLVKKAA